MMENADWEIFIDQGLDKPSGIDMYDDRLVVSDYATGDIIFYDISMSPPNEIGRIHTENQNNIMGIKIDSNQKIWYVNHEENNVIRIDYSLINGDINSDGNVNVNDIVMLVNYILNEQISDNLNFDLNNDSDVNVLDVVMLVELILN